VLEWYFEDSGSYISPDWEGLVKSVMDRQIRYNSDIAQRIVDHWNELREDCEPAKTLDDVFDTLFILETFRYDIAPTLSDMIYDMREMYAEHLMELDWEPDD
jgi:hypothetical protein